MNRLKFRRKQPEEVSVNLTPLIDVVFLLLIFFMVSTTFTKETHLEINLPEAEGEIVESQTDSIEVTISVEGDFSVNGQVLLNSQPDTLRRAIMDQAGDDRKLPFVISADANTPHQSVVTVMDVAGKLGFAGLSITTQQAAEE
ncbi:biopolymer transport protein ExbD [Amphritea japonica ATCC BAA-1530]|uniref:Biopolymer transport protein ExbD n=1 Tax=Amphritea japonica ATCC BAA-1530 TaxID=1278309 RepID=A0A7R6PDG5_9GAMM|nr:biopolymer transporter ExbD [Amphritea japonica]BBB26096.1 biopolymer transport protein ExbD [Amphritea japonica ATCC BAA-1530]